MSTAKKTSANPCHEHHSRVFRGMSLVKMPKQSQHLPQCQETAEGHSQVMIPADPQGS